MDVRQLRHFFEIAKSGSFTKAARVLHISQPALTRSIKNIETRYRTKLFERQSDGVALTDEGKRLMRHAAEVLNLVAIAENELWSSSHDGVTGVRIGIASLLTNRACDDALAQCLASDPDFSAKFVVGLYEELHAMLQDAALDVVVTTTTDRDPEANMVFEPLFNVEAAIFAGCDHVLAGQPIVEMVDLQKANWVTLDQPHMQFFLSAFFAQSGHAAPRSRVRSSSLEFLRSVLRQQVFVGFLPIHWATEDIRLGKLTRLNVANTPISRVAGILTRRDTPQSKATRLFIEKLRSHRESGASASIAV